jgi:hypothetical protein
MKKLSVVGTLFITILLMVQFPHWMLSPGEVIEGHQNIKNKCSECHQAFSGIDSQKCISCHKLDSIGMNSPGNMDSNPDSGKILFHQHLKSQECTLGPLITMEDYLNGLLYRLTTAYLLLQ